MENIRSWGSRATSRHQTHYAVFPDTKIEDQETGCIGFERLFRDGFAAKFVAENFIPTQMFEDVKVEKTWGLNAIRGGKFGIGWTMNQKLWPDADKVDYPLDIPQEITFANSSSRLHPMHIHGGFFRLLDRNGKRAIENFTRDTVPVGPRESVTIGFVPEHPGISGLLTSIGKTSRQALISKEPTKFVVKTSVNFTTHQSF